MGDEYTDHGPAMGAGLPVYRMGDLRPRYLGEDSLLTARPASERLRELAAATEAQPLNYGRVAALNEVAAALPLIADVVEAAERVHAKADERYRHPIGTRNGVIGAGAVAAELDVALTALRDALEEK